MRSRFEHQSSTQKPAIGKKQYYGTQSDSEVSWKFQSANEVVVKQTFSNSYN